MPPVSQNESLGKRIRQARVMAGVSARELSRLVGVADGHIALIESGERPDPRSQTLRKIADVLGVTMDWLARGEGELPSADYIHAAVAKATAAKAPHCDARRTGTHG